MRGVALALLLAASPAAAQDTLRLPELQGAAVRQDPRARQLELREEALGLRLRNLEAERLPRLRVASRATYDSEVATIPIAFPGIEAPTPPHDRYEATLGVEQPILDPSRRGRAEVERARLAVERAELEAELYPLRVEVSEAFFSAFLVRQRRAEILVLAQDLEARLAVVRARVREGAALPGDTATLRAELLGIRQQLDEVETASATAMSRLRSLTGLPLADETPLALPSLDAAVARASADSLRAHPGFAVLAARRESIARSERLLGARVRPSVSAFGQLGFGRPGPALFERDPHEFWSAGVELQWVPWTWRTTERERSLLALEERLVDTEEEALVRQLERDVEGELRTVERLRAALATDQAIIALREQVERQAAAQLAERVISPAEYVRLRTDLQEARLGAQRHLVELAQAQARYLTTLGISLEEP